MHVIERPANALLENQIRTMKEITKEPQ